MELIIEIIMEVLVEGLFEGFVALVEGFLPSKHLSKKARGIISGCLIVLACALVFGLIVGVILLLDSEGKSPWGWGLVSAAVIYLALGIILKFSVKGKEKKKGPEL